MLPERNPLERHFLETLSCGHEIEVTTFVGTLPAHAKEEFKDTVQPCYECEPRAFSTVTDWRELEPEEWDGAWMPPEPE